jgi:peptidoglycan hydrolase-like protein with peptidoglycan-binding domain
MTPITDQPATGSAEAIGAPSSHRGRRRLRPWITVTALVLLLAVGTVAALEIDNNRGAPASGSADNTSGSSLATVAKRDLTSQTQVDGVLQHANSYQVVNRAQGTITWLPAIGVVVARGHLLYRVDGEPVILLYGSTPAYRTLADGGAADDVTGPDVRELNANLVALGYATKSQLDPTSDEFGWRTKWALKRLQKHLGLDQTGVLALGQAVFLPAATRIVTVPATLGAPAQPGAIVLTATSTKRNVSVDLDVTLQTEIKVGDKVTITLPDNSTTTGVVSDVGSVATTPSKDSGSDTSTISVTISLNKPSDTAGLDQAPVVVSITTATAKNALVVPVNALLALAGGGYAVEIEQPDGTRTLSAVSVGLFDDADGLVQVTGASLAAGQRVVVPAQ